jgi:tripartite-type tricarboxylate transporter receptor subunit TctC
MATTNDATNATLYDKLPLVLVVNPSVPAKTVPDFVAYAKANPGRVNMASAGTGGIGHLAGELFKMAVGVNLLHVPYRGNGPALTGLLGGEVDVLFPSLASSIEYIRAGRLRGLAVTSAMRADAAPDLPSVGEFIPGYEISTWYGVGAPKGTPAEIIDKLNKEINAVLGDPKLKARFADLGDIPMPMTPGEFGKFVADETDKLGKVVKFAGIKVE